MAACRLLYVTCPDAAVAQRLAETVVGERRAACANLLPGLRSIYWWQGKVEQADEVLLLLKTSRARVPALVRRLKALHPYQVPCIVVLDIIGGHGAFLAWVAGETAAGRGTPPEALSGGPAAAAGRHRRGCR